METNYCKVLTWVSEKELYRFQSKASQVTISFSLRWNQCGIKSLAVKGEGGKVSIFC